LVKKVPAEAELDGSAFTIDWQVARPMVVTNMIKPSKMRNNPGMLFNSYQYSLSLHIQHCLKSISCGKGLRPVHAWSISRIYIQPAGIWFSHA
jgi:hypothetical protein